ncbi:MAG: hypothetical protein QM582_16540 [Micropruina sp.]|uniref:hypothetical protein n=1 Tax=Micropruina sp. TaxID=2737536 RepID=UPI0039E6B059
MFNLVALLVVGTIAETLHGARTLVGLVSEIAGYTVLPNQGFAGNSVADLGLTGLCLVTFLAGRRVPARVLGAVGLLAGLTLLVIANLHGVGFAVGAIAGMFLVRTSGARTPMAQEGRRS